MNTDYTVKELQDAKECVDSQILNRFFAEHPEDRVELIHKSQVLEEMIFKARHECAWLFGGND